MTDPTTTATTTSAFSAFLSQLIQPVAESLATAIAAYLLVILRRVLTKHNLSISAERQAQLEYFAKQGVLMAEELGLQKLASSDGAQKLSTAVDHVLSNVPTATVKSATDAIHAALPQLGVGAVANAAIAAAAPVLVPAALGKS